MCLVLRIHSGPYTRGPYLTRPPVPSTSESGPRDSDMKDMAELPWGPPSAGQKSHPSTLRSHCHCSSDQDHCPIDSSSKAPDTRRSLSPPLWTAQGEPGVTPGDGRWPPPLFLTPPCRLPGNWDDVETAPPGGSRRPGSLRGRWGREHSNFCPPVQPDAQGRVGVLRSMQ